MNEYQVDHSAFHQFLSKFDCETIQDDAELDSYLAQHPEVITTGCDDSHHCSATIMLFPHTHMGVSVVFAPQCTTERGTFFLYPGHIDALIEALKLAREAVGENSHDDMMKIIAEQRDAVRRAGE